MKPVGVSSHVLENTYIGNLQEGVARGKRPPRVDSSLAVRRK